ncbi:DUF2231 domain-containing protein [Sphingomonas sediminicola]|uniref:DUF2231 domain-containing protein n=1 Tax=Sphingomonas sediminicola TaxID=386874 RepID=UPI003CEA7BF8
MAEYLPGDEPVRVSHGALDTLHALLGALPIAYFLLAFLIDVTYVRSTYFIWPIFSIWLIVAGLVAGGLAVLIGIFDWLASRRSTRARGSGWHMLLTLAALLLGLLNAFVHSRDGWTAVVPEGIILSGVTTLLLIVAAFLGVVTSRRAA